jgi:hypothetical protein
LSSVSGINPAGAATVDRQQNDSLWNATVNDDRADLTIFLDPDVILDLNCKADSEKKMWVFLELPSSYPDIQFVRPRDSYCREHGRYVFVFSPIEGEDLYYAESYDGTRIGF